MVLHEPDLVREVPWEWGLGYGPSVQAPSNLHGPCEVRRPLFGGKTQGRVSIETTPGTGTRNRRLAVGKACTKIAPE